MQLKITENENDINKWMTHVKELKAEKETIEKVEKFDEKSKLDFFFNCKFLKDYGLLKQQCENEHYLKAKNEIDQSYLKSLCYTVNYK